MTRNTTVEVVLRTVPLQMPHKVKPTTHPHGRSGGKGNIGHMTDTASPSPPRLVHCVKLQKELPGLAAPPWPGELGQRIYENVSAQAWKMWEDRQKMILNEYRLMPWQKEAQELMMRHLEDFFFGENAALPPGYVPEKK